MPTLLRWKGCRFFFWRGDRREPPHVHVKKGKAEAKVWLDPVQLKYAVDLRPHEVTEVLRKVRDEQDAFVRAWDDHFGT